MELRARHKLLALIPTASVTDIAFLMIIYFMVTVVHEPERSRVDLPESVLRFELPVAAHYISIDRDGKIRSTIPVHGGLGEQHGDFIDDLALSIKEDHSASAVILKADASVPYHHVDRVLDSLKRARLETIYFQTRQRRYAK